MPNAVAIMQPYLFPYIGYFQLIHAVDVFVQFDDVAYINKGWMNRNNLLENGAAAKFTLPLIGASQNKRVCDIDVTSDEKALRKLCKRFEFAYSKAPQFHQVMPLIEHILFYYNKNLALFIDHSLRELCAYLKIGTSLALSSGIKKDQSLPAQERLIAVSKQLGATRYVNAYGALQAGLYDPAVFQRQGLDIRFIKTLPICYPQFDKTFVPNLSIIDIMMFNTPDQIQPKLAAYELVKGEKDTHKEDAA